MIDAHDALDRLLDAAAGLNGRQEPTEEQRVAFEDALGAYLATGRTPSVGTVRVLFRVGARCSDRFLDRVPAEWIRRDWANYTGWLTDPKDLGRSLERGFLDADWIESSLYDPDLNPPDGPDIPRRLHQIRIAAGYHPMNEDRRRSWETRALEHSERAGWATENSRRKVQERLAAFYACGALASAEDDNERDGLLRLMAFRNPDWRTEGALNSVIEALPPGWVRSAILDRADPPRFWIRAAARHPDTDLQEETTLSTVLRARDRDLISLLVQRTHGAALGRVLHRYMSDDATEAWSTIRREIDDLAPRLDGETRAWILATAPAHLRQHLFAGLGTRRPEGRRP